MNTPCEENLITKGCSNQVKQGALLKDQLSGRYLAWGLDTQRWLPIFTINPHFATTPDPWQGLQGFLGSLGLHSVK
jgi:hypothetical protein